MMMNLKNAKKRSVTVNQLDSLGTRNPDLEVIIDFILHTIYNRPLKEKSARDSRVALLYAGKGKNRKYQSTKILPPDRSSLVMKIRRANLVAYYWKNCLSEFLEPFDARGEGWEVKDGELIPTWFEGSNLPSDEQYDEHIKNKYKSLDNDRYGMRDCNSGLRSSAMESSDTESSDSESEYDDVDECALSETYSTDDEDEVSEENDIVEHH